MNLVSCDTCATVLDADKLEFPKTSGLVREGQRKKSTRPKRYGPMK